MISSSDIEKNNLPWGMVDDFNLSKGPTVVNTDRSALNGDGVHWICVSPLKNGVAHVYDPLGKKNKRVDSNGMNIDIQLIDRLGALGFDRVHFFEHASQLKDSTLCGWFSIYACRIMRMLLKEDANLTPEQADRALVSQFGRKASKKDERLLQYLFNRN